MYGRVPEGGGQVGFVWIRSSGPGWTARLACVGNSEVDFES